MLCLSSTIRKMQIFEVFVVFAVIPLKMATATDMPQTGLITDPNYAKIMQSFPQHNESDLLNIRSKLQSMNSNFLNQYAARSASAPISMPKHPQYDIVPNTPQSIADINHLTGIDAFLVQGDLMLTQTQLNDLITNGRKKREATSNDALKWPTKANGVIPYSFDSSLTPAKVAVINSAIEFWQTNACVQFQLNGAGTNSLQFFNGAGCYSYIGMIGGQQQISIGDGCEYLGIITHEIAHALGFYHEQSRYDRDKYVSINLANILSGEAYNYAEVTSALMNLYNVSYDYGSVMHYTGEDFAIDTTIPVMVATTPGYQQTMGQRRAPSFKDILTMNRLYGCTALCALSTTICKNGGYPDPNNCNQCKCPASFGGVQCDNLAPAENGICGASLTATTDWQDLSATVGTTTTTDTPTTCYWQLNSPPGTIIQVQLTNIDGYCNPGCFWNSVELKLDSDFTSTGMRFCCTADYSSTPYNSTTNLVPVIVYGSHQMTFTMQYRYIDIPTTTSTTFTTTDAPTILPATTIIHLTTSTTTDAPTILPATTIMPPTTLSTTTTTTPAITTGRCPSGLLLYSPTNTCIGLYDIFSDVYRLVNTTHFYTANVFEMVNSIINYGNKFEGIIGKIVADATMMTSCTQLKPLYRLMMVELNGTHFYTTNMTEKNEATSKGNVDEGILGYCVVPQNTSADNCYGASKPLYRFFSSVNEDYFYTTNETEMNSIQSGASMENYTFETIECWLW